MNELERYPNETLYSFLARLRRYVLPNDREVFNQILFGKKRVQYSLYFPPGLKHFLECYPYLQESEVIKMTQIPFFSLFLKLDKQNKVREQVLSGSRLISFFGLNACRFLKEEIRYCPECLQEDLEKYGEGYLHKEHYLPGMTVCLKHKLKLLIYSPDIGEHLTEFPVYIKQERLLSDRENADPAELKLAVALSDLSQLNLVQTPVNKELICSGLSETLSQRGLLKSSRLDIIGIYQALSEFYGSEFLEEKGLLIDENVNKRNWIYKTIRATHALDPVYVALLFGCFCPNLKDLTENRLTEKIKSSKVNHCENPVCPQKGEMIMLPEIKEGHNTKHVYRCPDCGQIISIKMGSKKEQRIILQYGDLWDEKLREFKNKGLSNKDIGRKLGISSSSIPKHLNKAHHHEIDEKVNEARKILLDFDKDKTKTDFIRQHRKAYRTLIQYDKDWFESYSLFKTTRERTESKPVDWERQDREILERLKIAKQTLLSIPERITKKALLERAGLKSRGISKIYPRSYEFFEQNTESINEFYIRFGKLSVDLLRKQGIQYPNRSELSTFMNDKRRLYISEVWKEIEEYIYSEP